jgi:hypothetical protein
MFTQVAGGKSEGWPLDGKIGSRPCGAGTHNAPQGNLACDFDGDSDASKSLICNERTWMNTKARERPERECPTHPFCKELLGLMEHLAEIGI